jgi:hypothetical protein
MECEGLGCTNLPHERAEGVVVSFKHAKFLTS